MRVFYYIQQTKVFQYFCSFFRETLGTEEMLAFILIYIPQRVSCHHNFIVHILADETFFTIVHKFDNST